MSRETLLPSARRRALALLLAGAIVVLFLPGCSWPEGPLPFDKSRWDAVPEKWSDTTRHRMADGLLQSGKLIGMSRADVTALLGEPSRSGYFEEYDLVYHLGAERGLFRIDSEWLVMRLASGTVAEARLVED